MILMNFFSSRSHAQIKSLTFIERKVDSLVNAGIDSILVYGEMYIGPSLPKDPCGGDPYFLIWRSEEKVYYQKFKIDQLDSAQCVSEPAYREWSHLYFLWNKYSDVIGWQDVEPFTAKFEKDGKIWYEPLYDVNSTIHKLIFYYKRKGEMFQDSLEPGKSFTSREVEFTAFDLLDRIGNCSNLNFQHNFNSPTFQLIKCIQSDIINLVGGDNSLQPIVK